MHREPASPRSRRNYFTKLIPHGTGISPQRGETQPCPSCESGSILRLRVSDDGVGFASERAPNHSGLGLVSMQERLRSVGGELSIWSKPSLGTLVEGTVPVKFKAESSELTVGEPSERK